MSFRFVQKSVTLNDLERRNGRYFALFQRIRVASAGTLRKSSRSLSHLLMRSCKFCGHVVSLKLMKLRISKLVFRLSVPISSTRRREYPGVFTVSWSLYSDK